jgi:tetratricopeptide (TPR) repeat protein
MEEMQSNHQPVDLKRLDIVGYVSYPNLINTWNRHVGTLYQISPNLNEIKTNVIHWIFKTDHTKQAHAMKGILKLFKESNNHFPSRLYMSDWPLFSQSSTFFKYFEKREGHYVLKEEYKTRQQFSLVYECHYRYDEILSGWSRLPLRHFSPRLQDFLKAFYKYKFLIARDENACARLVEKWNQFTIPEHISQYLLKYRLEKDCCGIERVDLDTKGFDEDQARAFRYKLSSWLKAEGHRIKELFTLPRDTSQTLLPSVMPVVEILTAIIAPRAELAQGGEFEDIPVRGVDIDIPEDTDEQNIRYLERLSNAVLSKTSKIETYGIAPDAKIGGHIRMKGVDIGGVKLSVNPRQPVSVLGGNNPVIDSQKFIQVIGEASNRGKEEAQSMSVSAFGGTAEGSVQIHGTQVIGQQNVFHSSYPVDTQSKGPIWFEVREPVPSFTGRRRQLNEVHNMVQRHLGQGELELTVISQITSISGLGGIGKSELARRYAQKYAKAYEENVIWIDAENHRTLRDSFIRLANKLKIATKTSDGKERAMQSIVEDTYQHFAQGKSLFIFDNAEQYRTVKEVVKTEKRKEEIKIKEEGIDQFLPNTLPPEANKPFILITSRNQKWEKQIALLELDTFTEDEAIVFIKEALDIKDTSQDADIQQLADSLQMFPLALEQAVAYIKQQDELEKIIDPGKKFKISDYLKLYEAEKLLDYSFGGESTNPYTKTTFFTWQVTLEAIKKKDGGQLALNILDIMAYCKPDNITTKLFLDLKEVSQKGKLRVAVQWLKQRLLDGRNDVKEASQEGKLGVAVKWLKQYSMVKEVQGELNIHRLVQHVIRLGLQKQMQEEATLRKALTLFNNMLEKATPEKVKYIQHAHSIWQYASGHKALVKKFIGMSIHIAEVLDNQGKYEEALQIYQEVFKKQKEKLGPNHIKTLITRRDMAYVLKNQGKYEEALQIYQEVCEKEKEKLGPNHPDTLTTLHYMALVLKNKGKYEEALQIYQEVFEKEKEVLGPNHPDTLITRNNMASVLDSQGKYEEALQICQEVFEKRKEKLGPDHPDTLITRNNMASVLDNQGNYEEALQIYQEVFEKRKEILGLDHPDTLITLHNMASVLDNQGKYEEALQIYQEVFEKRKEILGPDHPDTLTTLHNMAYVLENQGKYEEVLQIYQEVFEKRKEKLGPDHPDTLITLHNMAYVLDNQGKYEEALQIYQEVCEKEKEKLGPDHPDTLTTLHNMALVLKNQGKYEEALQIYQEVCEKEKLGPDHPDTLITRNNMASVLDNQGKYEEALQIYQEVCEKEKEKLGPDHPDTLITRNNMACVLDNQGKYEEALQIYQEVFEKRKEILGPDHPHTLTTLHNMALVLKNQGKYEEALQIYQEVFEKRKEILGLDHPDTLITLHNMASVLDNQRKYEEALQIYQEVCEKRKGILGPDHPHTLTTLHNMALVLKNQGKYEEALQIYQEVFEKRKEILGLDNTKTLTTLHNMASVLDNQGKYEEALQI